MRNISNDREIDNLSKQCAEEVVKKLEILKQEHNHKLLYKIKNSTTYLFVLLQWFIGLEFLIYIGYFLYLTMQTSPNRSCYQYNKINEEYYYRYQLLDCIND
jgi:hypothetical protein